MKRASILLFLLFVLAAAGCSARRSEPVTGRPFRSPSPEITRGEIAFDLHCSHCHPGGEKGLAPALNNKPLPGFLIKFQVRHGLGAMPAFSERQIDGPELDALVKYLKALRRN